MVVNEESGGYGERLYYLRPLNNITFRVRENRLLEVGFPLGAYVKRRKENATTSIVVKRYVKDGKRVYDIKDGLEQFQTGVAEDDLCDAEDQLLFVD